MTITLDVQSKKVLANIENLHKAIPRELRQGLYFIGKRLRNTASANILKKGRSGRTYKYKGKKHRASRPGESWANRSGTGRGGSKEDKAIKGIIYKVRGSTELLFGNDVKHAEFLEFGTKNMAARPAHKIAIDQNNRNIISILSDKIKKGFGV